VSEHETAAMKRSEQQKKQHKRKADAITEKEWEEGDDFKNATAKSEALKATMNTIEQRTGKSVARVRQLMTSISTKLNRSIDGFDSEFVFDRSKQTDAMKVMFARAKSCLESITTNNITTNSARLLTGITAVFLPNTEQSTASLRTCCGALGLNRQAKYAEEGLKNRKEHDAYVALKGSEIKAGDTVTCIDGYGVVKAISIDSITIELQPWSFDVAYEPASKARVRRFEPQLDRYERQRRSDTTPIEWIHTIEHFHRKHNCTSPNRKDIAIRRHPTYPRQQQRAPRIYRYESWNEIWGAFKRQHSAIAARIMNDKYINIMETITEEGTSDNANDDLDEDEDVVNNANEDSSSDDVDSSNVDDSDKQTLHKIERILEIMNQPYKYDMCMKCVCIPDGGKLEDAKFACVEGNCPLCGMDKLWSNGVRRKILKKQNTIMRRRSGYTN